MKRARLFDPTFRYYPAADTDVSRTFKRIRAQMKATEAAKKPASNVKAMPPKKAAK